MATPRLRFRKGKREVSFDCQLRFSGEAAVGSVVVAVVVPTRGLEAGLGSGIVRKRRFIAMGLWSNLLSMAELSVERWGWWLELNDVLIRGRCKPCKHFVQPVLSGSQPGLG